MNKLKDAINSNTQLEPEQVWELMTPKEQKLILEHIISTVRGTETKKDAKQIFFRGRDSAVNPIVALLTSGEINRKRALLLRAVLIGNR